MKEILEHSQFYQDITKTALSLLIMKEILEHNQFYQDITKTGLSLLIMKEILEHNQFYQDITKTGLSLKPWCFFQKQPSKELIASHTIM